MPLTFDGGGSIVYLASPISPFLATIELPDHLIDHIQWQLINAYHFHSLLLVHLSFTCAMQMPIIWHFNWRLPYAND